MRTALILLIPLTAFSAPVKPQLGGAWESPAGTIEITQKGAEVKGKIVEPSAACPFEKGAEVMKGELLEDSFTGEVRYCVFAPSCGVKPEADKDWAFALLLSDAKSQSLSGAGSGDEAPCAKGQESLVLKRPTTKKAKGPVGLAVAEGGYDPRGHGSAGEKARVVLQDGANYLEEGQFEKARKRFEDALKIAELPEAYNGVGVTYYARNEYETALDWYKKALRVAPEFGDAYYNMACIYALQKKSELALRYLTLAMLNGYKGWEEMEKDGDLDSLREDPGYKELLELK